MTLLEKLATFTNTATKDTTYLTHGIHPYPAKYIPQLPREIIIENSKERNTILDPFCGSGTTLLEATLLGRKSVGIDSNPIAALISKAKTHVLKKSELDKLKVIIDDLLGIDISSVKAYKIPDAKNLNHWFCDNAIVELSWLKKYIDEVEGENLRTYLLCIFSSIIVTVSNQVSDTKYSAKEKNLEKGEVIVKFTKKLISEYDKICELSNHPSAIKNTPKIFNSDICAINDKYIKDSSIDLIITSPPYPNSYDYYLYHKWRMVWLGYDVKTVQDIEIGSRHEHSSKKQPIDAYEQKMIPALSNMSRMLKPSKLAYFFIGDSIIAGDFIDMGEKFKEISEKAGFRFVNSVNYNLDLVSRYFVEKKNSSNKNQFKKMQHILVFESKNKKNLFNGCDFSDRKIAKPKSNFNTIILGKDKIVNNSIVSIINTDNNSIHTIGKYPAKFIPDIPRWAIESYSNMGDVVLDPFNGSGTTTLEATLLNRKGYGIDISPYACLLAQAKTVKLSSTEISSFSEELLLILKKHRIKENNRKHFHNDLFWFNERHLDEIEYIRQTIEKNFDGPIKSFFLSVLATTIKPCSYLDESQIKVKRDTKKLLNGTTSPLTLFEKNLPKYAQTFINYNKEFDQQSEIINDSVLNIDRHISENSVDLIVTSPPYINAMNYPMNHRYESFLLNLLNPDDSINHQTKFIGTERVFSKDYNMLHQFEGDSLLGEKLNDKLGLIFEKEPKRSYITYKYFMDMHNAFMKLDKLLKPNSTFVLVTGSNTIRGISIDTFQILNELLQTMGYTNELTFHYEIVKNVLKIKRHSSSDIIRFDGIAVLKKGIENK